MEYINFVNENDIRTYTDISSNVPTELLRNPIYIAQNNYIKKILGTPLYEELMSAKFSGTTTSVQDELLEQIKRPLCMYTKYEALPSIWIHIYNKGVLQKNGNDNASSVDIGTLKHLQSIALNQAEQMLNDFKCWLKDNKEDYPLYRECETNSSTFFSGIYFPKKSTKSDCFGSRSCDCK